MSKKCKIKNCQIDKNITRGMCRLHYRKWREQWVITNRPLSGEMERYRRSEIRKRKKHEAELKRKARKRILTEKQQFVFCAIWFARMDRCWVWRYGADQCGSYNSCKEMSYKNKSIMPTRLSLSLFAGPSPSKKENVCAHDPVICNNALCINPLHMRWTTHRDNNLDKLISGTTGLGIRNGRAVLSEEDVISIYADKQSKGVDLAKRYNVTSTTIYLIRRGKRWGHITSSL